MIQARVERATAKAAAYLRDAQLSNGGFESFSSPTLKPFRPSKSYLTTFTPALMLGALAGVGHKDLEPVKRRLSEWLLAQKSPGWSFNYWSVDSPERAGLPYPDDLDDTFCALIALRAYDERLVDESCLGSVVKLLISAEYQVGGPYRTWLAGKNAPKVWQDVDLAVNSNVACFLGMVAEPLPNLTEMMEKAILSGRLESPYYPSVHPLAYYLSRAYRGPLTEQLANLLLKSQRGGWWGNPLNSALSVSTLRGLGQAEKCEAAMERLLATQQPDGSWPAAAFCLDPAIRSKTHYSGSPALTTALVLESLWPYVGVQPTARDEKPKTTGQPDESGQILLAAISRQARQELSLLPAPLRQSALPLLATMEEDDQGDEIRLLPYFFNQSLKKPLKSPATLEHLGLASLYGWIAYSVYDDFLDGEGDPLTLSAANCAQRYSLRHFRQALPRDDGFQEVVSQTFDLIDSANSWEVTHCRVAVTKTSIKLDRLPSYTDSLSLSDRSAGHALALLGILAASGIRQADKPSKAVKLAARHYLAARQLTDDLHDWEADLRAGIITYVVADAVRGLSLPEGKYTFARLLPKVQKQVWHKTVPDICRLISTHTGLARRAAKASGILKETNIITVLADKIDASVALTLAEQSKALKFLAAYGGKTTPTADIQSSPKNQSAPRRSARHPI